MKKQYVIAEKTSEEDMRLWGGAYWNDETGFGDYSGARIFTKEEKENMYLPVGGVWMEVSS